MRKQSTTLVAFGAVIAISVFVLGGCGRGDKGSVAEVADQGSPSVSMTEISGEESRLFEYGSRELYAERGENQIYGVIYIPKGMKEPMLTVIYAHGYGATHQNGIQYAEKLAEHGYAVYGFDFCGGRDRNGTGAGVCGQ